ncbi:hypothetical protein RUM43_012345 [Polyplax serrata]|uniref:Tox-GHH domain-containing protein n=1 Tax=Polyplax serrata TaxID=468196 RepID=A0AAN8RSW1_POLSC
MRGRVVTPQGLGIVGIRVSVDKDSRFGFTLTRSGGWYDVLVNGGGAVTLQFQRSPFKPLTKTVFVPWNQIVVLPPIQMHLGELESDETSKNQTLPPDYYTRMGIYFENSIKFLSMESCPDHTDLNPIVVSSWAPEKKGPVFGKSALLSETQIVQESILIPGSDLHLMYQSSQSAGYFSLLYMRLTGNQIPSTLTHVHVRVEIEGSIYTKMYEADPDLTHIFAWNKRNVYKQKVYGVALAKISIGYQYSSCVNVIWETQTATLNGFVVDISDIGGWSLDVHHHYNFHEGILQRGDGLTLNLKNYPRMVKVLMGTGLQRPLKCTDCNGPAKDAKLLTPVALTTGPDGSLYVGDFNLVRRITPEGNVYTVYQLSATQVSYQYYLTVSPADGKLYISNPESHQIIKVLILEPVEEPALNGDVVVGSGERCVPGDQSNCGDFGPAKQAKLAHPKGLVIASDRTMYIADGTNIRAVDSKDIIHTLVGHHGHSNHWQPIPCKSAIPASQVQLQWPTGLVLSPLDGSLYFIDDRLVLKLTSDLKIKVVAGSALHCQTKNNTSEVPAGSNSGEDVDARGSTLGSLLAIAFSPTGDLYLAQSDSRKINTIKVVDSSGRISDFAGKGVVNEIRTEGCDCKNTTSTLTKEMCCEVQNDDSNKETLLSSNAKLYQISAIAIGPDGIVYVADQGSLHILSLEHYLPVHDENGEFKIPYPASMEMYVFNRYGQHISTRDLTSGKTKYSFLYSKNTSFGKLSTITDPSGNKILFLRDYSNIVSTIENAQDHKSDLKISGIGFLVKFSQKGKSEIDFEYDSISGLLSSRSDSTGGGGGQTIIYRYDKYGRVSSVILPTGEMIELTSRLSSENKLEVVVSGLDGRETVLTMDGVGAKRLTIQQGDSTTELVSYKNGTLISRANWGVSVDSVAVARFPLLELSLPIEAEMLPMWSLQKNQIGESFNEMEWKYSLVGDINSKTQQTVRRDIYVNKTKVLGIELDQSDSKEVVYNQEGEKLLTFNYSSVGLPVAWVPHFGHPVNVSYDRFNRLESWSWGNQKETYTYERHGLLSAMNNPNDGTIGFSYNDLNMLSKLTLPSGRAFQFTYDSEGGIRHITLPSGTKHSFSCQPSLGFIRVTYTPPGSTRSYIQHYSNEGALLQTVYPGDGARVIYRYHKSGLLSEVIHGDGKSEINYSAVASGSPSEVTHSEKDLEYKWDLTHSGGKLIEERIDFGSKTGLSNAKLTYEYDDNFRVTMISGRIGGQNLPELNIGYSPKTGSVEQIGQFRVSKPKANETTVFDGTALFSRKINEYFQEIEIAVTIHRMEVFRMEFSYDLRSRISQTRTYTRNVGVNSYTNTKNFTWDPDGQLIGVEAQEPWGFKYDANGNMLALNYRGNTIPMEYNVMDRIVKFGEGQYKYDNRGLVIQNAREERFHYNAKGLLVRATKRGRFDVRYYYDHLDRLSSRKDNYGNVTQFFYTNHERPNEIYSPRDGKLMSLVYDDRGHLIYAQVYRHKYYIATDECGTPVMVFNQYGEGIREIMRSPYGHIVYDSNPYLYLPVDFCGGLLDQVTSLVHMQSGQVYDPLIGQWMTPNWETIFSRISSPNHLHLYRFNGNDPINVRSKRSQLTDTESWLKILGYNVKNLAPQIYSDEFPSVNSNLGPGAGGELAPKGLLRQELTDSPSFKVASGFVANMDEKKLTVRELSSIQKSKVKKISILHSWQNILNFGKPGVNSDPPFGKGIMVTRTKSGMAVLNSVPSANPIYRDVFTSVFNRSFLLDLRLLIHGAQQDAFFFVKPETWKVSDDRGQLKRLGSQVNTTFHEKDQEMADIKIYNSGTVINLRYGTTPEKEKNRLLHHAKGQALRKAWHRERDLLRLGFPGSVDWSQSEIEEILKVGYSLSFEGEYVHDINEYPELAEDPFNIKFVKKENYKNVRKRKKRSVKSKRKKKRDHRQQQQQQQQELQHKLVNSEKDVEFDRHTLLKEISSEVELSNQNYDVKDFKKILSDGTVRRDPVPPVADETIVISGSNAVETDSNSKKCHVWWLSWITAC